LSPGLRDTGGCECSTLKLKIPVISKINVVNGFIDLCISMKKTILNEKQP